MFKCQEEMFDCILLGVHHINIDKKLIQAAFKLILASRSVYLIRL